MTTSTRSLGAIFRTSIHPQQMPAPLQPAPDLKHETILLDGGRVILEKDVPITMRDGIKLYADVYRPKEALQPRTPTIVFFAPFGKHGAVPREKFKNMDVDFTKLSKYTLWELPDPLRWCDHFGYSFVSVDPRGTWWSEGGEATYFSPEEGRDGYDVVEWIAQQEWSTGSIGWGAVSYFAMSAYQTAVLKPPHLKAIMPWEGVSDIYREVNTVGGIPSLAFQQMWMNMTGNGLGESEDHAVASVEHPLYDAWWQSKVVNWSIIDIPAFSVTGWSSLGLHLRGTIEAWKKFSSKHKYLIVHGGKEWAEYYKESNIQKQKQFWDRFLKNEVNEVDSWPAVQIDVRESATQNTPRSEPNFPPQATISDFIFRKDGKLNPTGTHSNSESGYVSFQSHDPSAFVAFSHTFEVETEITGYSATKLFIQCLQFPDVDIYVALQKIDAQGNEVKFFHSTQQTEASAGFGWLRLSHRELDRSKSIPERPYHKHQRRLWLRPTDIVEAQVEIWPSSTVWKVGETVRLVIKGSPFTDRENLTQFRSPAHGFGEVRIWYGGSYDSKLIVPIVK